MKVPPKLVEQIATEAAVLFPDDEGDYENVYAARDEHLANYFAQWSADQELEACCEWMREAKNHGFRYDIGQQLAAKLLAVRRPKPPSLAEQGLAALDNGRLPSDSDIATIRAALQRLAELEAKQ